MKSYERICKCGCGQIINTKEHGHYVVKNASRNSYFDKWCYKRYLTKKLQKEYGDNLGVNYSNESGQQIIQDMINQDIEYGRVILVEGR